MIGDEYLQVRAQLGTALFSLSTLAHGLLAGREVLQNLQDLRASLREPFLFLVAGGEKSGKLSLVNALFGREIIPVEAPPVPDKIHIFKYGAEEHSIPVYEQFVEHYRPLITLRDFNIVYTPASNVITHQHLAVVEQLLPAVDLVLFVFSISDPWAAPSWEFLDYISSKLPKNAVFILQQCDRREPPEVTAIAGHLGQNIRDKFLENRVFAVSAKKAYLSKTGAVDPEGLFQQSGFGPLESYINDMTAGCDERVSGLRAACVSAQAILREIAEKTRGVYTLVKNDGTKMAALSHDLEDRKSQTTRHAGGIQWAVAECYDRMQKRGEEILQQQGGLFKMKGRAQEENLRQSGDAMLEDSIRRQIQGSTEMLKEDLQKAWPQLYENLRKQFPAEVRMESAADPSNERTPMLQQAEMFLVEKISPQHFEQHTARMFAGVAEWLEIPVAVNRDGFTPLVAALTQLVMNDFHDTLIEATAIQQKFAGLGNRGKALAQFRMQIGGRREDLLAKLEARLRGATDLFYKEFETAFQPLQNFSAKQGSIFEPRIALLKQMDETLTKTGASLGLAPRPPAMQVT